MVPWEDVTSQCQWEETQRQTEDLLERLYLSADLGICWDPPKELLEECLGFPAESAP